MCQWHDWSSLLKKCDLQELPGVGELQGPQQIKDWCATKKKEYEPLPLVLTSEDLIEIESNRYDSVLIPDKKAS